MFGADVARTVGAEVEGHPLMLPAPRRAVTTNFVECQRSVPLAEGGSRPVENATIAPITTATLGSNMAEC